MSEAIELALAALARAGAAQADAGLVTQDRLEVRVRGEEIDSVQQAQSRGLELRAFVASDAGFRTATTSTSDLSPDEIERLAAQTVELARAAAPDPAAGLPDGPVGGDLPDLALFDPADRPWKVEDEVEACRRAERAARAVDPRIANSEGSRATLSYSDVAYGSSTGFLGSYSAGRYGVVCMPVAESDGEKQVDYWYTSARTRSELDAPDEVGRVAGERVARRLGARAIPTCEVPVIFEARVAGSLLRHLFGCLSGYALYRGASFLMDRLGESIASEHVTIVDDGLRPGGLGSRPFDAEGLPSRTNVLVARGRLEMYLYDTYSARKCGAVSTASAARAGSGVTVGPTNLRLEPGSGTLEELVAGTDRALLVTDLMGSGFNPVTGDYSRGAAGVWIEGGRIVHPVQEVTVAGHLGDMLKAIDAVAGDLDLRDRVASPSLRIARMTVAGQ